MEGGKVVYGGSVSHVRDCTQYAAATKKGGLRLED